MTYSQVNKYGKNYKDRPNVNRMAAQPAPTQK